MTMKRSFFLLAGFLFSTFAAGEGRLALKNQRDSTGSDGKATIKAQEPALVGEGSRRTPETTNQGDSTKNKAATAVYQQFIEALSFEQRNTIFVPWDDS
jgi:hypothetical protein